MRHGEYIALGKIEAILKTCAAVSNIVVYGSGTFIINDYLPVLNQVGFLLTDGFLPEVSQDWDQILTNSFLHRIPDCLQYLGKIMIFPGSGR